MFHEMQTAAIVCKIVEKSSVAATCEDVFHMATVGGADALGRPDLGRLAPGCRADIVFVRIDTPRAAPVYDPFKFLVLAAGSGDVDRVIVDGATVVERGEVLTFDVPEAVPPGQRSEQTRLGEAGLLSGPSERQLRHAVPTGICQTTPNKRHRYCRYGRQPVSARRASRPGAPSAARYFCRSAISERAWYFCGPWA